MWLEIDTFDHFVYSRLNFLQTAAPVYVRLMLVRSDPFYRDVPVSGVCARHQQEVVPGTNHHVIRAARDEGQSRFVMWLEEMFVLIYAFLLLA